MTKNNSESIFPTSKYRIMFSGSRSWIDREAIKSILQCIPLNSTIVVGDAKGADAIVVEMARRLSIPYYFVETHVADWNMFGKMAGVIRNKKMIDSNVDLLIAFPLDGPGTMNAIELAINKRIPCFVYRSEKPIEDNVSSFKSFVKNYKILEESNIKNE